MMPKFILANYVLIAFNGVTQYDFQIYIHIYIYKNMCVGNMQKL